MANIVRSTKASIDPVNSQSALQFGSKQLGEDVDVGQPLCMDLNGEIWKFNNAAVAAASRVLLVGVATRKAKAGQPVTPYGSGAVFKISEELLVPGRVYFCSATPGEIDDTATAVDAKGAFYATSKIDLMVIDMGKLA
jgi:hypothetical protein